MLLRSKIPLKYILGKIKVGLIGVSIYAVVIAILYDSFHVTRITIPLSIPMILGTVISFLLGFRSNQAYDRWWEARIIWGAIVNDSRTLARQVLTFVDNGYASSEAQQFKERFIRRQMGWCFSLSRHLRKQKPLTGSKSYMTEDEIAQVSKYSNIPNAILEMHGRDIQYALDAGWINQYQQVELDRTLSRLCDSMGKCERIKNTVFPATYSLYMHFAMNLFIALLPFGVIEYFGYMEIPLVIAVAASFMLIEKMAIHLQDPFENKPTDAPMTTISRNIERDLRQMLNDHHIIEDAEPVNHNQYYVL
ncbi:MAG: bestrophin family protein [Flavipsychrobacter sp.]